MDNTSGRSSHLFGLFELDNAGTILYSRPSENGDPQQDGHSVVGRNFFEEIGTIDNEDFLRRHFKNFLDSNRSVDSFVFEGGFSETPLKVKVLMTRGHETGQDSDSRIVILDIKRHNAY